MKRKKIVIPAVIGVAAVWFGSHAGAGFATGRQEVSYFVKFGWHSIWVGLFAMLITSIAVYLALEIARLYNVHDYRSWLTKLFEPYHQVPAVLWEVFYLYGAILAAGAAIAGAALVAFRIRFSDTSEGGFKYIVISTVSALLVLFAIGLYYAQYN